MGKMTVTQDREPTAMSVEAVDRWKHLQCVIHKPHVVFALAADLAIRLYMNQQILIYTLVSYVSLQLSPCSVETFNEIDITLKGYHPAPLCLTGLFIHPKAHPNNSPA
jgi:hypothetical protein